MAVALEPEVEVVFNPFRDLMMRATYSEARTWIEWIRVMTISDLAESMWVDHAVAERLMKAALWHGIVFDTGDTDGREVIYEYVPIPAEPEFNDHPTGTPEWRNKSIGCYDMAQATGMPVRIRTEREMRKIMSTSGGAGIHKRREQAYKRQLDAIEKRKLAEAKRKAEGREEPKWKKHKKNSLAV